VPLKHFASAGRPCSINCYPAILDFMALFTSVPKRARGILTVAVAMLAIGASATSLPNVFVQDDIPVVLKNADNHSLSAPWGAFTRPYWPKPFSPDLYRPLMSVGLAAQWVVGNGSPLVFRITSILLYAACAVAFFWLAGLLLPMGAAWVATALFAVHPVHVEAVAVAVNQGELIVGLIAALWVGAWIKARERGTPGAAASLGFIVTYLVTCFFKENAVILPGLLLAAELTVVRDERPWRARVAAIRPLILALAATGLVFLTIRSAVLDNPVGSFTAEGLQGLTAGQRALTMLGVVPEWVRLLTWPAHLQADYSPQEIVGATSWGPAQTLGLTLLAAIIIAALAAWRRAPVITFGILWVAVALFPVSNVLVPTGIVLAERTLFLASIGYLLAIGAMLPAVFTTVAGARPLVRYAAAAALACVVLAGMVASARRERTWANPFAQSAQLLIDAPLSYRSHYGAASLLWEGHQRQASEIEYQRALTLFPRSFAVPRELADRLRLEARCDEAIPLYLHALRYAPDLNEVRSSLIACLMYAGRYAEARSQARIGLAVDGGGSDSVNLRNFRATAERAIAEKAAPGTVRLTVQPNASDSAAHRAQ
jgi:protein O-mannosyl-transferase